MRAVLMVVTLVASGCGGGADPSCKDAVEKAAKTTGKADRVGRMIEVCEKDGWSGEMRRCIVGAADESALNECRMKFTPSGKGDYRKAKKSEAMVQLDKIAVALERGRRAQVEDVADDGAVRPGGAQLIRLGVGGVEHEVAGRRGRRDRVERRRDRGDRAPCTYGRPRRSGSGRPRPRGRTATCRGRPDDLTDPAAGCRSGATRGARCRR